MKFAEELFPMGTFQYQRSAGAYIDKTKAENFDIYARKIVKDMHFLGIITGNDSVGCGKTTEATIDASYLTWKINQLHGTNNTFTSANMFFNVDDLIKGSLKLPKYSVIVLDEGDDLTMHHMKEVTVKLKRYFRKCRQLNQIVILILPSFFELPKFFALARSHFLINVSFEKEFERGYFKFYGPTQKKLLYLKGKKFWDYEAHHADFGGVFSGSYCFFPNVEEETKKYLKAKHEDIKDDAQFEKDMKTDKQKEKDIKMSLFQQIKANTNIKIAELCRGFEISANTGTAWLRNPNTAYFLSKTLQTPNSPSNINYLIKRDDVGSTTEQLNEAEGGIQ